MIVQLNPGPSQLASPSRVGTHFGTSRETARALLKDWFDEQQKGGPVRVLRRGNRFYTTMAVLQMHSPRGRDEHLYKKVTEMERELERAYRRIQALEKRVFGR